MNTQSLIAEIDNQIAQLQTARAAIALLGEPVRRGPGRPPKTASVFIAKPVKRQMSAAGRAAIAAAQKKRWANLKKGAKKF